MAVFKATFEVVVEAPDDMDHDEITDEMHYDYAVFDEPLPSEIEVVRVARISLEQLD